MTNGTNSSKAIISSNDEACRKALETEQSVTTTPRISNGPGTGRGKHWPLGALSGWILRVDTTDGRGVKDSLLKPAAALLQGLVEFLDRSGLVRLPGKPD